MRQVFALVDANNFFVSCERIFRPDLIKKPVIVRSSNDGCVIARSNEAKALGIPMGAPVFTIRHLMKAHTITEFSGSFELYGDISSRLIELLRVLCPRTEAYSVDESFLDLSELGIVDYEAWGTIVKTYIWRAIGIPVSIGIASTKTLAKLASELAKKQLDGPGVRSFSTETPEALTTTLAHTPIQAIWGVGWRLTPRLRALGIASAADLQALSPRYAQQLMGIRGRQLVAELNGVSCFPIEQEGRLQQSISRTRVFGSDTNKLHVVEAALASLGTTACIRMRREHVLAKRVGFFLTTNKHKPGYRRWYLDVPLRTPTADTGIILMQLQQKLLEAFQPNQYYHRAGVFLSELVSWRQVQPDMLGSVNIKQMEASERRLLAVDTLNNRFGTNTLHYAAEDLSAAWRPRQEFRSPRYTTRWDELAEARLNL